MKDIILKAIQAHLNRDPQADTLFHEAVVSRSRVINESIRLGREFVLEDLDKPTAPNLAVDGADLLASVEADDVEDPDDEVTGPTPLPELDEFDDDNDGSLSTDELEAARDAFQAAFEQIEREFAELTGEDTDSDDGHIHESVTLIRDPDGKVKLIMDEPAGSGVAPVVATDTEDLDVAADIGTDDTTDMDTNFVSPPEDFADAVDDTETDVSFADEKPPVRESTIPRRSMSEARKAYLARKQ